MKYYILFLNKKCSSVIVPLIVFIALFFPGAGIAQQYNESPFQLKGKNITRKFNKFLTCNADEFPKSRCKLDPDSKKYLFDEDTVKNLQNYHFILVPGGDFDFFSELISFCEGETAPDLQKFFEQYPTVGNTIKNFLRNSLCPYYVEDVEYIYNIVMGAFETYESFFKENNIPFTGVKFYGEDIPLYIGDRRNKINLIAEIIESIEEENGVEDIQLKKNYILIGHSFGGFNIADFLVELVGGHGPNTPEGKFFKETKVRLWTADKREKIFNQVKGVVFLNTFVQGGRHPEILLNKMAKEKGITDSDPIEYYIQYVLENYLKDQPPDDLTDEMLNDVLRSARYRLNYYFKDKNYLEDNAGISVQNAVDTIANSMAIISVCCLVPKLRPEQKVATNFLVHHSKIIWETQNLANDGEVNTYSGIFPKQRVEYVIMNNMDHGTLVLKPKIPKISTAWEYDQLPFIKTLLKHLIMEVL